MLNIKNFKNKKIYLFGFFVSLLAAKCSTHVNVNISRFIYTNMDLNEDTIEQTNDTNSEEPTTFTDIIASAVRVQRTERNPLPLTEKLEELNNFAKTTPPCIKGQEGKYLNQLLLNYQNWFKKSLGSKETFDETAFRIEKLGRKREVHVGLYSNLYFIKLNSLLFRNILRI